MALKELMQQKSEPVPRPLDEVVDEIVEEKQQQQSKPAVAMIEPQMVIPEEVHRTASKDPFEDTNETDVQKKKKENESEKEVRISCWHNRNDYSCNNTYSDE